MLAVEPVVIPIACPVSYILTASALTMQVDASVSQYSQSDPSVEPKGFGFTPVSTP
jgi:hypothetical protein